MIYVGIDPGQTGAMVGLYHNNDNDYIVNDFDEVLCKFTVNEHMVKTGHKVVVGIEKVHSMPGQGVSSTFKFGRNYGWWMGLLAAHDIVPVEITPQKWKKHYGLIGKPKDAARSTAIHMFPGLKPLLMRKKDHNRADALLIAQYMKETVKV